MTNPTTVVSGVGVIGGLLIGFTLYKILID